jgi:UDP:flavonoid glycosyltransferase YjiC (YdhE family)
MQYIAELETAVICLVPHCGYLSSVTRMLEIHRALAERGIAPRVITHGGTYEHVLRDAGVRYDTVGPPMSERRCAAFLQDEIGVGRTGQSMYSDAELRAYVRAETAYFRTHRVTVAVTGFTLTAMLSAPLAGARLVTEHAGCWVPPVFEAGLLPVPATPAPAALGWLPRPLARRLFNAAAPRMRHYCSGFNRVAAELGAPAVPGTAALVLGDLALVPEIPQVLGIPAEVMAAWEPASDAHYRPGSRLRYSGPLYARLATAVPARVMAFLDAAARDGRPVIYVAITSSLPGLVAGVIRALSGLDARILVAGTVHDLGDLGSDRILVERVLPSHRIMARAALAVTAGGQGSVQTALAAGTPLIGIPLQPEQDLNIVLAERLGAARRIAPRHAGSGRMTALAGRMLADGRYRTAAGRIRAWYQAVDGPGNAAAAIIELAGDTARDAARDTAGGPGGPAGPAGQ